MREEIPSKAALWGHPIHPMLIPFPIAALVGVLVTDLVYNITKDPFWTKASQWLLLVGIVMGALAGLVGAIDYFSISQVRRKTIAMAHGIGNVAALLLSVLNLMWHSNDASNPPIAISFVVVVILVFTGWLGGELSYRYLVGVNSKPVDERQPEHGTD